MGQGLLELPTTPDVPGTLDLPVTQSTSSPALGAVWVRSSELSSRGSARGSQRGPPPRIDPPHTPGPKAWKREPRPYTLGEAAPAETSAVSWVAQRAAFKEHHDVEASQRAAALGLAELPKRWTAR